MLSLPQSLSELFLFIAILFTQRSKDNLTFREVLWTGLLSFWRQHVLTCDIIVQLFPWTPTGQPAFTAQCDCQHSFPGLTRGVPHNRRRRHWAMSLATAGWASMADQTLSHRRLAELWPLWTYSLESTTGSTQAISTAIPQRHRQRQKNVMWRGNQYGFVFLCK